MRRPLIFLVQCVFYIIDYTRIQSVLITRNYDLDSGHPTEHVHRLLAQAVEAQLQAEST